ncbi:hypothetical protein EVAR_30466_1 [Eumeta japonica]|uniref:Uncharacterized protein n=1 Tax=Eumeta variegata TaxID=151549 RepID=A0A4C1VZ34_EUMVA|nr:hypothetical protein EVAR_30466_1 [Eumeta japonica]
MFTQNVKERITFTPEFTETNDAQSIGNNSIRRTKTKKPIVRSQQKRRKITAQKASVQRARPQAVRYSSSRRRRRTYRRVNLLSDPRHELTYVKKSHLSID